MVHFLLSCSIPCSYVVLSTLASVERTVRQQRKRKRSPLQLHAALRAVNAGFGVRPTAVPQCFCLIDLYIRISSRTGLRQFLYETPGFAHSVQDFAFSCTKRLLLLVRYRICPFPVRNSCFCMFCTGFSHFLYKTSVCCLQCFTPVTFREDIAQFLSYFLNFVHVTLVLHINETYILTSSVIFKYFL